MSANAAERAAAAIQAAGGDAALACMQLAEQVLRHETQSGGSFVVANSNGQHRLDRFFQGLRAEALEEAAQLVEGPALEEWDDHHRPLCGVRGPACDCPASRIAAAIRALKEEP